ncbi:MAG: hypothetical protein KDD19_09035 [Phaeodactylibacter sp.]|nr:hypothetical protein [Phaeodactylibacter sp.]MCB9051706.1 hypothetical protein [Lewinellaceae bacterium]
MKTPITFAQPGALDGSFGNSGYAAFDSGARIEEARAVVQQPDGKLLVAGFYQNYPRCSAIPGSAVFLCRPG